MDWQRCVFGNAFLATFTCAAARGNCEQKRNDKSGNSRTFVKNCDIEEVLDWLLDRSILDQSLRIKHVRSSDQLADLLTQGSFSSQQSQYVANGEFYTQHCTS